MARLYVRDEIGAVVASMRESVDGSPYFMFGHILEMKNRLKQKGKDLEDEYRKYPLIALRMDYPEEVVGGFYKLNLNMAILAETDKGYNAEERDTEVFKPVLYPIYDLFFLKLRQSGKFTWEKGGPFGGTDDHPPHKKYDRPYFGTPEDEKNVANIYADPLDAIEIVDLEISLRVKKC